MQIGTGWLGWTERETLDTAIPTIELAYEGLTEKLYVIQVQGFERPRAKEKAKPTAKAVFEMIRIAAAQGQRE